MCLGCVKRHATNWHNHSIGPLNASAVLCPHEGCHGAYEVPHFRSILPASQFERLQERQQRFKKSGTAWCPSCQTTVISFDKAKLQDAAPGTVPGICSACNLVWCYHCLRPVSPIQFMAHIAMGTPVCQCAILEEEQPMPGHINRYFLAPGDGTCCGPLPRNYELSVEECVRQIQAMCTREDLAVQCAHCHTPVHRATACNEMTHCNMRFCNICGMHGLEHESILMDHWDASGTHGCPRYMTDSFWDIMLGDMQPRCVEGTCHSDQHDCHDPAHAPYRDAVRHIRRRRMVHSALTSLPYLKRRHVIDALSGTARDLVTHSGLYSEEDSSKR